MHEIAKLCRVGAAAALLSLAGCAKEVAQDQLSPGLLPPVLNPITETNQSLRDLPQPSQKVVAAVYSFTDQTGQFKPVDSVQTLSKAVTQGAGSVLVKALQDVGNGSWFTVVERERIDNLLKERSIIAQMRMLYLGEKKINPKALPPLLFAGIIFEGGIIGYDSNLQTGGLGARLLGIGGDVKYRLDTITVYLRAVSTKTGEVLASVTTHKTIASVLLEGDVFKYISIDKILEAEAGFTKNEPDQLAVQQAIEKAVYAMVVQGAELNIWSFADKKAQSRLIEKYRAEEEGAASVAAAEKIAASQPGSPAEPATKTASAQPAAAVTAALPERGEAPAEKSGSSSRRSASTAAPAKGAASMNSEQQWKTSLVAVPPLPERPPAIRRAAGDHPPTGNRWATSIAEVEERFGHVSTSR